MEALVLIGILVVVVVVAGWIVNWRMDRYNAEYLEQICWKRKELAAKQAEASKNEPVAR